MNYKVLEIFSSVQGEGRYQGCPCIFIRLAGCPIKCNFCDTDYDGPSTEMDEYQIMGRVRKLYGHFVVITGGEPLVQDLRPLLRELAEADEIVHVETSGAFGCDYWDWIDWVTVSPKEKAGYRIDESLNGYVSEVKLVVTDDFKMPALDLPSNRFIYLQPESNRPEAAQRAYDVLKAIIPTYRNARLGVQAHKVWGLR